MKNLCIFITILIIISTAFAQGTINFTNLKPTRQIITDANGEKLEGAWAQLYAGTTADNLEAIGVPVAFYEGKKAGYFNGGAVRVGFVEEHYFQVRVWKGADNFENATATGKSNIFKLKPGDQTISPPALPTVMDGLQSFSIGAELTASDEETFGAPIVYSNNAATVLGQVNINGEVSEAGDIVAIYVGDELRGKQEVIVDSGVAWLNAQVNAAGGEETISFKVYDESSGATYENSGSNAVISPGAKVGSFSEPLLIKMDSEAPVLKLEGEKSLTINQGSSYTDAGASATDNVDGDITANIIVSYPDGEVNTFKSGHYTIKYDVEDAAGHMASATRKVIVSTHEQIIYLKKGWNLVSINVVGTESEGENYFSEEMEAEEAFTDLLENEGFEEILQIKNLTRSWDPSLPDFLNTLRNLNVTDGYWINAESDTEVYLEGNLPNVASITVKKGWNLVGYPKGKEAAPVDELKSLGNTVVQFKNLSKSYDPSLPTFLNTLNTIVPGDGYWLNVSENGNWALGDETDSGQGREITKMGPEKWGEVVVYPNLTATVLAEVTLNGKTVSEGSMVAAFVGEELRGKREVVLSGGKSYGTLNVNLEATEQVSFRIWEENLGEEFEVADSMSLEIGETYGTATALVQLDGAASSKVEIISLSRAPFGFSFKTDEGRNYEVEASFDLEKWNLLRQIKGTGEEKKFIDVRRAFYPRQYYRVKETE